MAHAGPASVAAHQSARLSPSRSAGHTTGAFIGHADRRSGAAVKPCGAQMTPVASTPQMSATLSAFASSAVSDADVAGRATPSLNDGLHRVAVNPLLAV